MEEVARLASDAADGDPLAAAALVRATQSDVWRLCAALGDRDAADDLTQETYLRDLPAGLRLAAPLRRPVVGPDLDSCPSPGGSAPTRCLRAAAGG